MYSIKTFQLHKRRVCLQTILYIPDHKIYPPFVLNYVSMIISISWWAKTAIIGGDDGDDYDDDNDNNDDNYDDDDENDANVAVAAAVDDYCDDDNDDSCSIFIIYSLDKCTLKTLQLQQKLYLVYLLT